MTLAPGNITAKHFLHTLMAILYLSTMLAAVEPFAADVVTRTATDVVVGIHHSPNAFRNSQLKSLNPMLARAEGVTWSSSMASSALRSAGSS